MAVQKKIVTRKPISGSQSATGALALGVAGNVYDNSPLRAHPYQLVAADAKTCGYYVSGQKGLIINPREYALVGGLQANLSLRAGQVCTIGTFGHFIVELTLAASAAVQKAGTTPTEEEKATARAAAITAFNALSVAPGADVYYKSTGEITDTSTGATKITGARFIVGATSADAPETTTTYDSTSGSEKYTVTGKVLAVIELN